MISKQQIKYIRSLHQKKCRDEYNTFIAEGFKIVNEAIEANPLALQYLIYTSASRDQINFKTVQKSTTGIEVTAAEFLKITSQSSPQEVLAVIKKPELQLPTSPRFSDISLVLDRLRDPGNFGTIIRLADWFGVKQIFCSADTVDCYNTKVVQSSMGAIFRVDIYYVDLKNFLEKIKPKKSSHIYSTSLVGTDVFKTKLSKPAMIVLGNEARGISDELIALSDENLSIPNYGSHTEKSESLNVSLAAAIICSEFRRQTGPVIQNEKIK